MIGLILGVTYVAIILGALYLDIRQTRNQRIEDFYVDLREDDPWM